MAMNRTTARAPDPLALVSPLYGPGNIAAYYLTFLAIVLSWTLHPYKRVSGSIDIDFMGFLIFGDAAAGHLLYQIQTLPPALQNQTSEIASGTSIEAVQRIAAIEASLNAVEMNMILYIALAWAVTSWDCFRRALLIVINSVVCMAIMCYFCFTRFEELGLGSRSASGNSSGAQELGWRNPDRSISFSRLFLSDFKDLFVTFASLTWTIVGFFLMIFFVHVVTTLAAVYSQHWPGRNNDRGNRPTLSTELKEIYAATVLYAEKTWAARNFRELNRWTSRLIHPFLLLPGLVALHWDCLSYSSSGAGGGGRSFWEKLSLYITRYWDNLFPKTSASITDLDQAITMTSGAMVLAFRVYSIVKARYELQCSKRASRRSNAVESLGVGNMALSDQLSATSGVGRSPLPEDEEGRISAHEAQNISQRGSN